MALPSSGAISLNDVNVELGLSGTAQISLNDSVVRALFGVGSGAISMSDGYGKSSQFVLTISSNQTNADLRTLAVNAGWDQSTTLVANIDSGVVISSNNTGTAALSISGSYPSGLTVNNSGVIVGLGGNGGKGGGPAYGGASGGSSGGTALSVSSSCAFFNNGTIAGGGGGGGGGGRTGTTANNVVYQFRGGGGGGGGGGRSSAAANSSGGGRGTFSMNNVNYVIRVDAAGNTGTNNGAGNGGIGGIWRVVVQKTIQDYTAGSGGNGGNWGAGGNTGGTGRAASNYGNHYPESNIGGGGGGGGGNAVTGNSYITWGATGTRYGGIA